jgi:hypothetical protein
MSPFGLILASLALAACVVCLRRLRAVTAAPRLTDDMVRRIEEEGVLRAEEDEPLDLHEISDEEERFWSESWDEPEEL